jgi:streptogramin lyase
VLEALELRCLPSVAIQEFPLPTIDSFPTAMAAGPDGNIWFLEQQANKIGRITPAGVIIEFSVPTPNSNLSGITAGPDGNLWFTELDPGANKIGRITPAGNITEFSLPTTGAEPFGITRGPDGNLWFTEYSATSDCKIGRITLAGTVTEFPIAAFSDPIGITTGPDGNLWFTQGSNSNTGNRIGRIAPDGSGYTSFLVPTVADVAPTGITAGPDGDVWFTEYGGPGQIGRITPAGIITEFPTPTLHSSPLGITLGPDGALWFAEQAAGSGQPGNAIGRITTAGVITEFRAPTSQSSPDGIATGSDGNIWFTENYPGKIGKAVLPRSPLEVTSADAGGAPRVNVYDGLTGTLDTSFLAYSSSFLGGVRVALGDINGDGIPDIITAPGPGGGPDIRVFDGVTGGLIMEFMAYAPRFRGGVYVAVGDVTGGGVPDIITAPDLGGVPDVRVWDGKTGKLVREFMAYSPAFLGGVRVAAGDVNGNGHADIITAPGVSGGPEVKVFDGASGAVLADFYAYDPHFLGGVYVAAGDVSADGKADIVTSPGAGGDPDVRVFRGATFGLIEEFAAYAGSFRGGVRVAVVGDINGDGKADIVTAPGPNGGPDVRVFDGTTTALLDEYYAYDPHFLGGVFVGGA